MSATAEDVTTALRDRILHARAAQDEATDARLVLDSVCIQLLYKPVRVTCPHHECYRLTLWGRDRNHKHDATGWNGASGTWFGSERTPLIGMVIDYEITDKLAVRLIVAPHGGSSEYRIDPYERTVEVLDRFPDEE